MHTYNLKNPFVATVNGVRSVTKEGSAKETIHIDFDLSGSDMPYVTGDALAVIPCNDPELVDAFIAATGLCGCEEVTLKDAEPCSLREALIESLDITKIKKPTLTKWNKFANSDKLAALIDDKDALKDFMWGHDLLDIAADPEMKASFPSAQDLVDILGKQTPRLYSIASSPDAVENQVSLCVGAVRYTTNDRKRGGVCSTYMADRLKTGDKARVYNHTNKNFRLPEDGATPIIMVGPGTGVAPFRAFWQQRVADKATGKMWFFFGNPYAATDGCYEDEIAELVESGILDYSVAWSRDQEYKIYVQNLMQQQAAKVWEWLEAGAAFYMCGDANRMAKDVENTLLAIIAEYGKCSPEEAAAYLADMKANKRYQKDVY